MTTLLKRKYFNNADADLVSARQNRNHKYAKALVKLGVSTIAAYRIACLVAEKRYSPIIEIAEDDQGDLKNMDWAGRCHKCGDSDTMYVMNSGLILYDKCHGRFRISKYDF